MLLSKGFYDYVLRETCKKTCEIVVSCFSLVPEILDIYDQVKKVQLKEN
jgi:hypothetical protein